MNAVLTIGYDRYVLSIEDAAKVMKLLSEAKHVTYHWGRDEEDGTTSVDRYVENQRKNLLELSPLNVPVTAA
jgi:DNA-binding response OmpR family regulator